MDSSKNLFWASVLLRIGIAFVFLYAAIASFAEPDAWVGYLPVFLRNIFPAGLLLSAFSVFEIIVSLWLLWGKYIVYPASLAALTLIGIIAANFGAMDVVFRDVGILFMVLALGKLELK